MPWHLQGEGNKHLRTIRCDWMSKDKAVMRQSIMMRERVWEVDFAWNIPRLGNSDNICKKSNKWLQLATILCMSSACIKASELKAQTDPLKKQFCLQREKLKIALPEMAFACFCPVFLEVHSPLTKVHTRVLLQANADQKLPRLNDKVAQSLIIDETRTHCFANCHFDRVFRVQLCICME